MNELDFDELDKAVNSLMSGMSTDKRNTALDDPEDTVVSLDGSIESVPASQESQAEKPTGAAAATPQVPTGSAPRPSQPLAVKRRGQFMDMIHPSSDMKPTTAPKREGLAVQPSSPFVPPALSQLGAAEAGTELKNEPSTPVLDVVTPTPTASPEFPTKPVDEELPAKSVWPDPIELANSRESQATGATSNESGVASDVVREVAGPGNDEPLLSPFLPDAKVEKRPLGGNSSNDIPGETEATTSESVSDSAQTTPVIQLPEELKTDVMALESTSTSAMPVSSAEAEPPQAPHQERTSVAEEKTSKVDAAQTGSGSIPQQYKEQPSSGDQTNAPIYDTSTHQPLAIETKKTSPVKWIVLALVLLIIGAIAGVAYFYFTTH